MNVHVCFLLPERSEKPCIKYFFLVENWLSKCQSDICNQTTRPPSTLPIIQDADIIDSDIIGKALITWNKYYTPQNISDQCTEVDP